MRRRFYYCSMVLVLALLAWTGAACGSDPPPPGVGGNQQENADDNDGGGGEQNDGTANDDQNGGTANDDQNGGTANDDQNGGAGECEPSCGSREVCQDGECVCDSDYRNCGGECVDTDSDPDYCGGCDNSCEGDLVCDGGTCGDACQGELSACEGGCVDFSSSDEHCGYCGHQCGTDIAGAVSTCNGGTCNRECTADDETLCKSAGVCTDLDDDVEHCGECDNACETDVTGAQPVCDGGTCSETCVDGDETLCENYDLCTDLQEDVDHCGSCGNDCSTDVDGAVAVCDGGDCAVECEASGETFCSEAEICTDLDDDRSHCGGCGDPCGVDEICTFGTCESVDGRKVAVAHDYRSRLLDEQGSESWSSLFEERTSDVAYHPDGDVYVSTGYYIASTGTLWFEMAKFSEDGTEQWRYFYEENKLWGIAVDDDDNVYLGSGEFGIAKYPPPAGQDSISAEWSYDPGTTVKSVAVDADGDTYIGRDDSTVTKLDAQGDHQWNFTLHGDTVHEVAVDDQGYVYSASEDSTVYKIDSYGDSVWSFDDHDEPVVDVDVDDQGYVYTASEDQTARKLDADGNEVWRDYIVGSSALAVSVDPDGFVYVGAGDGSVRRLNPDGEEVWSWQLDNYNTGTVWSVEAESGRLGAFPMDW